MPSFAEMLTREPTRPLRRVEYEQLVAAGAFEDENVELLEGKLVIMAPQGSSHAYAIQKLTMALVRAVRDLGEVRVQCPLALSDLSEPEPDFAVVAPDADVLTSHPSAALLVIEVAEASLRRDRDLKGTLYARAGIPEYWIVDVDAGQVHVHRNPHGDGYRDVRTVGPDVKLSPGELPGVTISTAAFLPQR